MPREVLVSTIESIICSYIINYLIPLQHLGRCPRLAAAMKVAVAAAVVVIAIATVPAESKAKTSSKERLHIPSVIIIQLNNISMINLFHFTQFLIVKANKVNY